jgi:hypothetical protein
MTNLLAVAISFHPCPSANITWRRNYHVILPTDASWRVNNCNVRVTFSCYCLKQCFHQPQVILRFQCVLQTTASLFLEFSFFLLKTLERKLLYEKALFGSRRKFSFVRLATAAVQSTQERVRPSAPYNFCPTQYHVLILGFSILLRVYQ